MKATGGIAGHGRSTQEMKKPVISIFPGRGQQDEGSLAESLDPYVRLKTLQQKSDNQLLSLEELIKERNKDDHLSKKITLAFGHVGIQIWLKLR